MNRYRHALTTVVMIAAVVLGGVWTADAQQRNSREVRDAVRSLNSKLEDFEYNLREQMRSSSANSADLANVSDDIRALRDSVNQFQDNLDRRRENRDDVNRMIDSARRIDQFLKAYPQNRLVEDAWEGVRSQVDRIAPNYGVTADWNRDDNDNPGWVSDTNDQVDNSPTYNAPMRSTVTVGLSGTYELDTARSESIDDIVTNASLGNADREDLKDKLVAPQQITLDIRGSQVTLSTSSAAPVTITADGRDHTERSSSGKTVRLRATLNGDTLTVSSLGGDTDYTITFTSVSNGRVLKVQRRITTDYLSQTVIAESLYNKTGSSAQTASGGSTNNSSNTYDPNGGYSDNDQPNGSNNQNVPNNGRPTMVVAKPGSYTVPNGTIMTGILENEINTRVSQNNDRFRLTVQSPMEFRGAVIEGHISGVGRSGKVTGNSNVTFNFERIRLRNGQTYDLAGYLQGIRDSSGRTVKIDNEGTARGDSQTNQTAKRGGIGAGIGAIIGAIAGGGKGAAIGAILGGGAGAGSVIVQGRDDIRLMPGSTITLQAVAPNNSQNYPR
ncbi:MAG: hypothetical protein ABIV21_01185 [Pyrinomonadaceae bacterium]